jgi:Ca2+-binding RTX toxin-like protein
MRLPVLALAMLLLLVPAGVAHATTFSEGSFTDGAELVVTPSPGDAIDHFYSYVDGSYFVFGNNGDGSALAAGTGCDKDPSGEVRCTWGTNLKRVRFDGGAGNDDMGFGAVQVPIVGTGGAGDDAIGNGTKPGDFDGGPGNDYLDVGKGGGKVNGGDGDDYIDMTSTTVGPDDISGGAGNDGVNYSNYPSGVTVTLDDIANDGAPGQNQNIHSDIDYLVGSRFADRLVGGSNGEALYGREGNDTLIGNGGTDYGEGDGGDDVIDLADDIGEKADCGPGNDEAIVDAVDTLVDCEKKTLHATDADKDGDYYPLDCDDHNPAFNHSAKDIPGNKIDEDCSGADAPLVDLDRDGATNDKDCNDTDSSIHPGAVDKPKDKIDQDCSGKDADYPLVFADINATFIPGARTRVAKLTVEKLPAKSRVEVRCRGGGCPFKKKSFKPKKKKVVLTGRFHRSLSPGAVLEVRVLVSGSIGKVRRTTIRANRAPKRQDLCLRPKASRATTC